MKRTESRGVSADQMLCMRAVANELDASEQALLQVRLQENSQLQLYFDDLRKAQAAYIDIPGETLSDAAFRKMLVRAQQPGQARRLWPAARRIAVPLLAAAALLFVALQLNKVPAPEDWYGVHFEAQLQRMQRDLAHLRTDNVAEPWAGGFIEEDPDALQGQLESDLFEMMNELQEEL